MNDSKQSCPICQANVTVSERYPNRICNDCYAKEKLDDDGIVVTFGNIDFSGGFSVSYYKDGKCFKSIDTLRNKICYIDGHKCIAQEARFGGIAIQKIID